MQLDPRSHRAGARDRARSETGRDRLTHFRGLPAARISPTSPATFFPRAAPAWYVLGDVVGKVERERELAPMPRWRRGFPRHGALREDLG
jgi:hypothetical protein